MKMKIISPTIAPLYLHLPLDPPEVAVPPGQVPPFPPPIPLVMFPLYSAGYAAASSDSVAHIHDAFLPIPIFCV